MSESLRLEAIMATQRLVGVLLRTSRHAAGSCFLHVSLNFFGDNAEVPISTAGGAGELEEPEFSCFLEIYFLW